jgi:hypothetical protein
MGDVAAASGGTFFSHRNSTTIQVNFSDITLASPTDLLELWITFGLKTS